MKKNTVTDHWKLLFMLLFVAFVILPEAMRIRRVLRDIKK